MEEIHVSGWVKRGALKLSIAILTIDTVKNIFTQSVKVRGDLWNSSLTDSANERKEATGMSVYKIVEIVGTSPKSWEDATQKALATAAKSLEELRVAEVVRQDVTVEKGKITAFRIRLNLSFKYRE
jgi:flavin-binding protein dodecin